MKVNNVAKLFNSAEIGRRLGVSEVYAHMILSGQRPGLKHRKRIAKIMKKEVERFEKAA